MLDEEPPSPDSVRSGRIWLALVGLLLAVVSGLWLLASLWSPPY
jgi:hypothetical protein